MLSTKFTKLMSAEEAVNKIPDNATVGFCGAGGGITEATKVIEALAKRYKTDQQPKNLNLVYATGLGDRDKRGLSPLAQKGMVKRSIGGHWGQSPRLAEMAENNEIEAYNFPQGVICQEIRASVSHQPGILTHVGLGTFVDPDQQGGRLNECTKEELVKKCVVNNHDYLFYPSIPLDVAVIRGTTADTDGYITMEDEIIYGDALVMAQSAHNHGGLVIVQVQKVVKAGTLHPKQVRIPGIYVDAVVVDSEQTQLYQGSVNRFLSGDYTHVSTDTDLIPLNHRKVVGRRALMEIHSGDVGNVGVGIADNIGIISREEGLDNQFTLTVETGAVGGESAQGIYFGSNLNTRALVEMPTQFDFYDGGGLDVCFLSFAEVDKRGNVNVHHFNGKIMGTGGFIDICQNTHKVVFCGTLTAGGLKTQIQNNQLSVIKEGKFKKFINQVQEITFNGNDALARGQEVYYVTERGVFKLTDRGLKLIEIAPGIDLNTVLDQLDFKPIVDSQIRQMDSALFNDGLMDIKDKWLRN